MGEKKWEQQDVKSAPSTLEGLDLHNITPEIIATRLRLRDTQLPYQTGDVFPVINEQGQPKFVRISSAADPNALELEITTHNTIEFTRFDDGEATFSQHRAARPFLDKFTRGVRADLAITLSTVADHVVISQDIPMSYARRLAQSLEDGVDEDAIPEMPDDQAALLYKGAQQLFYEDPPKYKPLLSALEKITVNQMMRLSERKGYQFDDIKTPEDLQKLRLQMIGDLPMPADGAPPQGTYTPDYHDNTLAAIVAARLQVLEIITQEVTH